MSTSKLDSKAFKSLKRKQSRNIRSEINDPSLNKETVLNVNDFLKSRKFEITELEKAQLSSKYASSTRVFQHLPRKLRRRTASHNVKRIPKRLRNRALREMNKNDSAPNIKKRKPKGQELYRLRTTRSLLRLAAKANLQKLVPSEANLSLGKLKLRQRIKKLSEQLAKDKSDLFTRINNKVGSYDITSVNQLAPHPIGKMKFMKRQKQFVWLNTHIWHAKRAHMIKRWGFQIPSKPTQKCFRLTHRNFNLTGGITWDKSFINTCVLQSDNQNSLIELLQKITKTDKIGKRFVINGSVFNKLVFKDDKLLGEITILSFNNDGGYRFVLRVHPSFYTTLFEVLLSLKTEDVDVIDNRFAIGSIDIGGPISLSSLATILKPIDPSLKSSQFFTKLANESSLPNNTVFTLEVKDPRTVNRKKPKTHKDLNIHELIIDMKRTKENLNNQVVNKLFTSSGRTDSYQDQLSLKDLQKLKRDQINSDSKFPVIIYKHNDIWTVLLPWFWLLPVWYQLTHIAHMNHGGLFQTHQLNFENNKLFFPDDYPFTDAGLEENSLRSEFKRSKWTKKPKSKRFNYNKLKLSTSKDEHAKGELGDPFGCDWRYLQTLRIGLNKLPPRSSSTLKRTSSWDPSTRERKIEQIHDVYEYIKDVSKNDKETLLRGESPSIPVRLSTSSSPELPKSIRDPLPIIPISLTMLGKGNPTDNARIYSIPSDQLSNWLKAHNAIKPTGKKQNEFSEVPPSSNLIGFITSGSYNLSKGKNTGIGSIDGVYANSVKGDKNYCLVRNVGTSAARLASWEQINV